MSLIVKQSDQGGPTLVNARLRMNGLAGFESTQTFRGTHAECAAMLARQAAAGIVEILDWEQEGPISTITIGSGSAQDGSADKAFDTWEVLGNNSQEDMSKADSFRSLTPDQVGLVDAAVAQKQSGQTPTFSGWPSSGSVRLKMNDLYNLKLTNHVTWYDAQYVFKKTRWLSQQGQLKADFSNVFRVYTTDQLQVAEVIPNGIRFSLAAVDASFKVITFSTELNGLFKRGWLKFPPVVNQVGGHNKVRVDQEYWLSYWALPAYAEL